MNRSREWARTMIAVKATRLVVIASVGFRPAGLTAMVQPPAILWCRLPTATTPEDMMDIRALTPTYAVSPQIEPSDLPLIRAAGYRTVIDNRPDGEIPEHLHTEIMRAAVEAEGLTFAVNPIIGGQLTMANVEAQAEAIANLPGPVLAYCASGNRSSVVWALAHAGQMETDDLIGIPARFGYQLEHLRPTLDDLASRG